MPEPYDMSLDERYDDNDIYMEEIIECPDCGREGPRYEIEGRSCGCTDPEFGDAA